MPGFIDAHIHMPQAQVIASWGAQLLDWLNTYTFPEELKFSDPAHAARIAGAFLDELLAPRHHHRGRLLLVASDLGRRLFHRGRGRGLRMIGGKVMMDRNAPRACSTPPQASYDDSKALIDRWHGRGRGALCHLARASRSPRRRRRWRWRRRSSPSIPTCTCRPTSRRTATRSTSPLSLYPEARDYLDVYESYGLLGPKSLFGHAIHLSDRETAAMAATGSVAVFCPTSNLFLGSGLYDKVGLREKGVRRAIATDVGGGTNYSMLRTLDEGYKVLALRGQKLDPLKAFWWITRGNAEALSLADRIGTLAPGARPTSSCSTAAPLRRWRCGRETVRRWRRSCSCSRRSATTGRSPRPMSPASAGRRRRGPQGSGIMHRACTSHAIGCGRCCAGSAGLGGMKPPLGRRLAVGRLCGLPPAEAGFARRVIFLPGCCRGPWSAR